MSPHIPLNNLSNEPRILYEKVMPILVKMPKNFSSTQFRTFLQELQITKERLDWWTNEMFDILCI